MSDADYLAISGTLQFAGTAGETHTIEVSVNGDPTSEGTETFLVQLSNVMASGRSVSIADNQGTGTITNDDTLTVEFSQATGSDVESGGGNLPQLLDTGQVQAGSTVTITVSLDGSSTATGGGTDYTDPTTLTVTGGTYSATAFAIPGLAVVDDSRVEPSETIVLNGIFEL